jgi:hypothetical protein
VAELYKTLFGVDGSKVDLAEAAPPGGHPTTALPAVRPDGTVVQPPRGRDAAAAPPEEKARREDEPSDGGGGG